MYQVFDGAGIVTSSAYDFKGNLLEGRRDLLPAYRQAVNWLQNPAADDGSFFTRTTYDALNRPITVTSPDNSVYCPTFNEANLLDKVDVNLRGAATATPFVLNIDYDAKGQRTRIDYGNGASTFYEYDPLTFRLIHLRTARPGSPDDTASQLFSDATIVQDLSYTYDPVGNITRIEDSALRTVYYNSRQVDPIGRYTYDAVYRLIEARGREHIGQSAFAFTPTGGNYRDYPFAGSIANPNDLQALRNYIERYEYDSVGNFEALRHAADAGGWTRTYNYEEESLFESSKKSNRLTGTTVGNGFTRTELYTHDAHGNMTTTPHLAAMAWDFEDQLQQVDLGGGGRAYYVYEAAGQRIRKVIESQSGVRQKERIYLGGFEIYREYSGNGAVSLVRESLHIMDDKQRIALVDTRTQGNDDAPQQVIRYQLGNHLGSASVELDSTGALISYEEYYPYGATAFQAGRSASEVSLKRYRYTGKERDDETGFSYHGARYYAPWLGRWTACDPSGLEDGENLYLYTSSNPIRFSDPTGKKGEEEKKNQQGIDKVNKVIDSFKKRVEKTKDKDTGGRPGLLERFAVQSQWNKVWAASEIISRLKGKKYEMARKFFHHYLVAGGAPLVYTPPQPVQDEIAKRFPKAGQYRNVNPYNRGIGDIRNSLGHFNLDVIDMGKGEKMYMITDRYEFPEKDEKGRDIYHGFQIGKMTKEEAAELNDRLYVLGEYEREKSKIKERFRVELEKNGEYTFYIPQRFLADHGVDYESLGRFKTTEKNQVQPQVNRRRTIPAK